METAVVGLYFVLELIRNICVLMDDSLTSKIIFACLDVVFMVILNLHKPFITFAILFRIYSIISFCQTTTNITYTVLDRYPEWLTYVNVAVATVDVLIVIAILGREVLGFLRSQRFADAMNRKMEFGRNK